MKEPLAPTHIAILGGTGDLAKRKLLPALFDLYVRGALPEHFSITGIARSPRSHEAYRVFVSEAIRSHNSTHEHTEREVGEFCEHISYIAGSFEDASMYQNLQTHIGEYKTSIGLCTNTLFYLAVPPAYYETIFKSLHTYNLHEPCDAEHGWSRVLVEKPFGHDRASAEALDTMLSQLFNEEQVYRIDHYLAKEAVQNILSFRFANTLTKAAWNRDHIERITITMHETVDVASRGSFYDGIGALRDVGQNHLLQLLALVTMEEPDSFTADAIRTNRAELLETLIPATKETIANNYTRAQYEGYQETEGVEEGSATETAFRLTMYLEHNNWMQVPITIEAGKALAEAKVVVKIQFKDVATGPFETDTCHTTGNTITLTIQPEQEMSICLNAKSAGLGYQLESRDLSFTCNKGFAEITNSYERVLLDCMRGDQTLFTTSREVTAQWQYINSIIDHQAEVPLTTYEPGSVTI